MVEHLSLLLAQHFERKCYTELEIYCFKENFRSIAGSESEIKFWGETAICRFLQLPEALDVGHVVFQMVSYLGAFPFPSQAPAILDYEALLKTITLLTGRYDRVLKRGRLNWTAEIYRSLAVYDKTLSEKSKATEEREADVNESGEAITSQKGYSVDIAASEEVPNDEEEEEEEDELVLAALESLDAIDVMKHGELSNLHSSAIPFHNFRKLVELLLLIAPIQSQERISRYSLGLTEERLLRLREVANCIVSGFTEDQSQGVLFKAFKRAIRHETPFLFDSLKPLFESFLFDKNFNLSKDKDSQPSNTTSSDAGVKVDVLSSSGKGATPLLEEGDILDGPLLSQLSFFINGEKLFHRLRLLYTGGEAGFSMGSFEKHVFNWNAPSILLVSGTILDEEPSNIRQRSFVDSLPTKRLPSSAELREKSHSSSSSKRVVYGAYVPAAWQATHKYCFGDSSTLLFQLSPVHDLYTASTISKDYVYYNKPPTATAAGIGLGTPIAKTNSVLGSRHSVTSPTSSSFSASSLSSSSHLHLGPVSLHLDDALEFGVFTHLGSTGGGSFQPSKIPGRKGRDWQDRFSIESLEVWGCDAGDEEADRQRKRWEWEEREAKMRRKINLGGTGDVEADRELLKMAGIIGTEGRSGGSVG